jgi:hypothetical protein
MALRSLPLVCTTQPSGENWLACCRFLLRSSQHSSGEVTVAHFLRLVSIDCAHVAKTGQLKPALSSSVINGSHPRRQILAPCFSAETFLGGEQPKSETSTTERGRACGVPPVQTRRTFPHMPRLWLQRKLTLISCSCVFS